MNNIKLNRVFTQRIAFNHDTHTYQVPGITQEIFNVTKIINPKAMFDIPRVRAAAELGQEIHNLFSFFLSNAGPTPYDKVFAALMGKIQQARPLSVGEPLALKTDKRFVAEFLLEDGEKFYVGGTCDALITYVNGIEVIELKTTTRESNDHLIQLAAYTKFAQMCGGGDHFGMLAYLDVKDVGQKVKYISHASLEVFWEQFLAKIARFLALEEKTPEVFTYVKEGDYVELTPEQVRELIIEYTQLAKRLEELARQQKEIRDQLNVIAEKNNLSTFEINGAKYAKINSVKKSVDTELIEAKYPGLVRYETCTRVAISCAAGG